MKHILSLVAALSLAACASIPSRAVSVPTDGTASMGQSTRVGTMILTPQMVIEDSRCPVNARCIWAGRLILRTRIGGSGRRETIDLTLGEPYSTHGRRITLVSAEPGRMAGSPPAPPASRFGFEVR